MANINRYDERIVHRGYKRDKSKRKAKKADHKHDYEKVIGVEDFIGRDRAVPYLICRVCGKTDMKEFYFKEELSNTMIRMVTDLEEVKEMHPELRVVRLDKSVVK